MDNFNLGILNQLTILQKWHESLPSGSNISSGSLSTIAHTELIPAFTTEYAENIGSYSFGYDLHGERFSDLSSKLGITSYPDVFVANSTTSHMKMIALTLKSCGIEEVIAYTPIYPPWYSIFHCLGIRFHVKNSIDIPFDQSHGQKKALLLHDPEFGTSTPLNQQLIQQLLEFAKKTGCYTIFDSTLSPDHRKYNDIVFDYDNIISIISPLKRLHVNHFKVSLLYHQGYLRDQFRNLYFNIGDDLGASTQWAISYICSSKFDALMRAEWDRSITAASCVRAVCASHGLSTDAQPGHMFTRIDFPKAIMRPFLNLEIHRKLFARCGIAFVPSCFYKFTDGGNLGIRVNLGNDQTRFLRTIPALAESIHKQIGS